MKQKSYLVRFACLIASLMFVAQLAAQPVVFAKWDFDAETLEPSIGIGTALNIGGTSFTWAAGNGAAPNRGWNTSTYPAQGTNSGTAGVQFFVSTLGYQNIMVSYAHRGSGTASRWAQVEYTTNGGATWTALGNNSGGISPHDTFYPFTFDLTGIPAASNNANFGIRVVSIFSPFAFDQNATLTFGPNEAYQRANAQSGPPGTGTGTGDYGTGGTWRFDDVTFSGDEITSSVPTQLAITNINGGIAPQVNIPFSITVQSLDANGVPSGVTSATGVVLSVQTGTGTLGGNLIGVIPVNGNSLTLEGLTYNVAQSGVVITAATNSGMALTPATSIPFQVLSGATQLVFNGFPATGNVNQIISPFTVNAVRDDNSIDEHYNGMITLSKAAGPGGVSGALAVFAENGIASFNNIVFDMAGEYTLAAAATGLTGANSGIINIAGLPAGTICYWSFNNDDLIPVTGNGTAANVGGTTTAFATGITGAPDRAWNTTTYPEQATGSETAGVEFMVSTSGYHDIQFSYFHRSSGTASRYVVLQYTLNGSTWIDKEISTNGPPHDTFIEHNIDFTAIAGANDNPSFGVRLLAVFSPEGFTDPQEPFTVWPANTAFRATRDDRNYTPSGTWRFDEVFFTGTVSGGLLGDANCDGILNVLDIITTVNYVMGQNPQPFCPENADVNSDGIINILDIVNIVNLLLGGGK